MKAAFLDFITKYIFWCFHRDMKCIVLLSFLTWLFKRIYFYSLDSILLFLAFGLKSYSRMIYLHVSRLWVSSFRLKLCMKLQRIIIKLKLGNLLPISKWPNYRQTFTCILICSSSPKQKGKNWFWWKVSVAKNVGNKNAFFDNYEHHESAISITHFWDKTCFFISGF